MHKVFLVLIAAALSGVIATHAEAQNLVVNPSFTSNANSWFLNFGVFDPAAGSPAPGSIRVDIVQPTFGMSAMFQCVTGITAGNTYSFGGNFLLTQAVGTPANSAWLQVNWFSDNACSANNGVTSTPAVSTLNAWTPASFAAVAPAGTVAATIGGMINSVSQGSVNFDEIFLQSNSVPALPGPWMIALALLLAGIGWLAMRRGSLGPQRS